MREIKFRAWGIEDQRFLNNGYRIDKFPSENQTIKIPKQVKIQLFTGLKDKNGKEIYEGDIVVVLERSGLVRKLEIIWHVGSAGFKLKEGEDYESLINYDNMEIVGNIYENPELLQQ